jgi:hypothetical protein
MKFKLLVLLIIFLTFQFIGLSQTTSSFGLEAGITFSQFSDENIVDDSWETRTTEINPIVSTLIGISKSWLNSKHFQFTSGLQYHLAGNKSYTITDPNATDSYSEEWNTLKMSKLCVPLTLGYLFRIGKLQSSINLGVRPNIILSGNMSYIYHSTIAYEDRIEDNVYEYEQNLFEENDYYIPPKRIFNQFSFGLSTSIGQHFAVNLTYSFGHNYYTSIFVQRGNYSTYTWSENTSIPGSDFVICIQYYFNRLEKRTNKDK